MNQTTFLRQLRLALILRLPGKELHAIEDDYKGFFSDRIKEGKTESEICQEFGSPKTAARNILQETGRNVFPLGLLVFLGTALAGYLNWGWTWKRYRFFVNDTFIVNYALQLTLIPLLWACWKKELADGSSLPVSKKWMTFLCGGGMAAWTAAFGYSLWGLFILIPEWQTLPPEAPVSGSNIGHTLGTFYDLSGLVLVILIFLALLRVWLTGNPNYLPAVAWCLGLHCSLNRQMMCFTRMDLEDPFTLVRFEAVGCPIIALAVVGIGGTVLTTRLIRRGGRHGRTA